MTPAFLVRGRPDPAVSRLRLGSEVQGHGLAATGQAMPSPTLTKVQLVELGN
jgi:hypothetical protein